MSYRAAGDYLRALLEAGVVSPSEAVAWADRVIVVEPEPAPQIVDISLAGRQSVAEMTLLLGAIPGLADEGWVATAVLARLGRDLAAGHRSATETAIALGRLRHWLPEPLYWQAAAWEDDFALAGLGESASIEELTPEFLEWLGQFTIPDPTAPAAA